MKPLTRYLPMPLRTLIVAKLCNRQRKALTLYKVTRKHWGQKEQEKALKRFYRPLIATKRYAGDFVLPYEWIKYVKFHNLDKDPRLAQDPRSFR